LVCVVAVVAAGLLFFPDGILADEKTLADLKASDAYLFEVRRFWPSLLHPDTLLICQEPFLALSAVLLLARGACSHGSTMLALSLVLLSIARVVRFEQWGRTGDYMPEGPLGGLFAACCAGVSVVCFVTATRQAVRSTCTSLGSAIRDLVTLLLLVSLCAWIAKENHMTAHDDIVPNVLYSFGGVLDLCGLPLLAVAICYMAVQKPLLGGAMASLCIAQVLASVWFLDFIGLLQDSMSEDAFIKHDLKIKQTLMTQVHGHPYALFAVGQVIRTVSALVACGGYAVIRLSAPDSAPLDQPLLDA